MISGFSCSMNEVLALLGCYIALIVLTDVSGGACQSHLQRSSSRLFQKITNTMTLVDYPLFSGVVVIYSLHVSSFREAHHQEFIFPVQSASGIVCNLLL